MLTARTKNINRLYRTRHIFKFFYLEGKVRRGECGGNVRGERLSRRNEFRRNRDAFEKTFLVGSKEVV